MASRFAPPEACVCSTHLPKTKAKHFSFWLLFVDVKNSPCNNSCPNEPPKSVRLESPCNPFTGDASCKAFLGCFKLQLWDADNLLPPPLALGLMQHNFILPYPTWLRGQIRCDPGGPGYEQKSHSTPCAFCTWLRPLHPREPQFYLGAFKGQCVWSILQLEHCQKLGTGGHSHPHGHSASSHRDHISHLQGST